MRAGVSLGCGAVEQCFEHLDGLGLLLFRVRVRVRAGVRRGLGLGLGAGSNGRAPVRAECRVQSAECNHEPRGSHEGLTGQKPAWRQGRGGLGPGAGTRGER